MGGTRTMTLEVPDEMYTQVLRAALRIMEGAENGDVGSRTRAVDQTKRAWIGPGTAEDAEALLMSVTKDAWPVVEVFVKAPEKTMFSTESLATEIGLTEAMMRQYRMLIGKQAWRYGNRINPISARRASGVLCYYMRPEAHTVFTAVLRNLQANSGSGEVGA